MAGETPGVRRVVASIAGAGRGGVRGMTAPLAVLLGALAGIGVLTVALALRPRQPQEAAQARLRTFRAKGTRAEARKVLAENSLTILLAAALGAGGWALTGWPVAGLLGGAGGLLGAPHAAGAAEAPGHH